VPTLNKPPNYTIFFFILSLVVKICIIHFKRTVKKEKEKFTYCTGSQRVKHNNNDYLY
jgi:hypothetical protein